MNGDILNIDVTLYHGGFHGDLNETYYVGPKALADADSVNVVETARQCLDEAIKGVKPGMAFKDPGDVIEKYAKSRGCSVIKTYCGHGINQLFHCAPNVPHYAKNKAVGTAKPGMCFTIEPMISLGSWRDKTWPDDWTSVTQDGSRTAQFGEPGKVMMMMFLFLSLTLSYRTYSTCDGKRRGSTDSKACRFAWRACRCSDERSRRRGASQIIIFHIMQYF